MDSDLLKRAVALSLETAPPPEAAAVDPSGVHPAAVGPAAGPAPVVVNPFVVTAAATAAPADFRFGTSAPASASEPNATTAKAVRREGLVESDSGSDGEEEEMQPLVRAC